MIEVNPDFGGVDCEYRVSPEAVVSITPPIDAKYFIARVPLARDQAIQIFPKFFTIGCGFAQEEDWNTNLPFHRCRRDLRAHPAQQKIPRDHGCPVHRSHPRVAAVVARAAGSRLIRYEAE